MKRRLRLAARLYPRSWRDRYGEEFEALLEDVAPAWGDGVDIVRGAVKVHITSGKSLLKFSAIMGAIGLVSGAIASFSAPKRHISTGVVRIESDPGADDRFHQAVTEALSRGSLAEIIQRPALNLYPAERSRYPMEDIIEGMRKDIRVVLRKDGAVEVSAAYSDPAKAEAITRAIMNRLAISTDTATRNRASTWQKFWPNDPPPPGQRVVLVSEPRSTDQPVASARPVFLAIGTAAGILAGWLLWRPKRNLQLAGFAMAGAVVAIAVSFTIRDRYISSAVLRMTPPQAPKRLWTGFTPEAPSEHFQQLATRVAERNNLARITDRMHAPVSPENIRITAAGNDAFVISFQDRDRIRAQAVVRELVTQFVEGHITEARARQTPDKDVQLAVGLMTSPSLEVLDPATLPESPVFPNRLVIGAVGLPAGLIAGVFVLRRRRAVPAA
jgi:hypothetical protein